MRTDLASPWPESLEGVTSFNTLTVLNLNNSGD
jgi:hypothetical protein